MATQKTIKLSDYYVKNKQSANKNVVTDEEGNVTTENKITEATTQKSGLMSASDKIKLESLNNYTHPAYTPRTGKPLDNQVPTFGDTFTVSQITSDETGHITNAINKTIQIPDTLANGTIAGLSTNDFNSTYKTNIDNLTSATGTTKNAHTHTTSQITNFPTLKTVATSGSYNDLDNKPFIPQPSTTNTDIKMNGTQSAGGTNTTKYAKADHVHPSDTSKLSIEQGNSNANMTLSTNASGKIITELKNNHTHNYISTDNGAVGANNLADGIIGDSKISSISYSKLNGVAAENHEHNVNEINGLATVATTGSYNSLNNTPLITKITPLSDISTFTAKYEYVVNEYSLIIVELRDLNNNLVKNTDVNVTVDKGYFFRKGNLEWDNENDCYIGHIYEGGINSKSVTVNTGTYGYGLLQYQASERGIPTFEANNVRTQILVKYDDPLYIDDGDAVYHIYQESRTVMFKYYKQNATFTNTNSPEYATNKNVPSLYRPISTLSVPCAHPWLTIQITSSGAITVYATNDYKGATITINGGGVWQY